MYKTKTEDVYEEFSGDKEMSDFSNHSNKLKYYDNSNQIVIAKMKDETAGVAMKGLVGLKPKMYLFLVDNSKHKKAKGVNRNVAGAISHNE